MPQFRCWSNVGVLSKKNWQLKAQQYRALSCGCLPCTLLWELLLPVAIIVLFSYLKSLNAGTSVSAWEQPCFCLRVQLAVQAVAELLRLSAPSAAGLVDKLSL